MIIHPGFIGIDVSKHHLDIFDATTQHAERIDNTAQAIISTFELLQADPIKLVVFEASGSYDGSLRSALTSLQLPFVRVNPARARDFAKSIGLLAKTDAIVRDQTPFKA
ncbi:IS110 family transposase [Labrys sp. 22185]|uniref:IS110 family transposase n=1 Tax=Labrys sp. 22185 TaxID=3453888 RepID=UPI003F8348D9